MRKFTNRSGWGLPVALLVGGVHAQPVEFELIAQRTLQPTGEFWGTTVGGISGVDYEPISDRWVMVSDGSGPNGPTRAYEFGVLLENNRLRKFQLLGKLPMNHGDGTAYDAELYDPEAVRLRPSRFFDGDDQGDPTMIWVDEGAFGGPPVIYEACMGATWMDQWPAPEPVATGGRDDLGFESLAMMPDGSAIAATADAIEQDGSESTWRTGGQTLRLWHYDLDTPSSKPTRAWAYRLADPPETLGALATTALVELDAIDQHTLIAMERSTNPLGDYVTRLYRVELSGAADVSSISSLKDGSFTPARKTMLADLGEIEGVSEANYEGLAIGPKLADGRRLVVVVSDNGFNTEQATRILFLAATELDGSDLQQPGQAERP